MSSNDRRRLDRRQLSQYLKVTNTESGEQAGHMVDLNEEGIMLISLNENTVGDSFRFEMELPKKFLDTEKLEMAAECRWCRRDVNPDFFVSGFKFNELMDEGPAVIHSLVRDMGFRD